MNIHQIRCGFVFFHCLLIKKILFHFLYPAFYRLTIYVSYVICSMKSLWQMLLLRRWLVYEPNYSLPRINVKTMSRSKRCQGQTMSRSKRCHGQNNVKVKTMSRSNDVKVKTMSRSKRCQSQNDFKVNEWRQLTERQLHHDPTYRWDIWADYLTVVCLSHNLTSKLSFVEALQLCPLTL